MSKIKKILKSQTGQGVWEYMVILIGIGAIAFAVSKALNSGLVGDGSGVGDKGGTTGKVVKGVEDLIITTVTDAVGETDAGTNQ